MSVKDTINDIHNTDKIITYKKENPSFEKIEVIEPVVIGGDVYVHGYFLGYDTPLVILHLIWAGNIKVTLLNKKIHGLCPLYTVLKHLISNDVYRKTYGWRSTLIEIDYDADDTDVKGIFDSIVSSEPYKSFIYISPNDRNKGYIHVDLSVFLDFLESKCSDSKPQHAGSYKKQRRYKRLTKRKKRKSFKKRQSKRKTKRRR